MKCPICDKDFKSRENPFRPFCSERCKLIDLGHWLDESYVIKGNDGEVSPENQKNLAEKDKPEKADT